LTPVGVRVGYASPQLLSGVGRSQRTKLTGRVVWVTTANAHYSASGLRPGTTLAKARRVLSRGKMFKVGSVSWYLLPGHGATILIEVQGGVVREVGLAQRQLTRSGTTERALVRSLS